MWKARNTISGIRDSEGVLQTTLEGMTNMVTQFYGHLFTSSYPHGFEELLDCVTPRVIDAKNNSLCAPYTRDKVDCDLNQMHLHKAPGPDGMNPFFFQKF